MTAADALRAIAAHLDAHPELEQPTCSVLLHGMDLPHLAGAFVAGGGSDVEVTAAGLRRHFGPVDVTYTLDPRLVGAGYWSSPRLRSLTEILEGVAS